MAGTIVKIKQSSVAGRLPTHNTSSSTDIVQGELALNTADQKLYSKDSSGTVFEIGGSSSLSTANDIRATEFVATASQTSFAVTYSAVNDHINVFFNGVWLPPTDFTATSGTAVVLDTGAPVGTEIVIQRIIAMNLTNGSDIDEHEFTATAGQTSFTISGGYDGTSSDIEVFVNGVKLRAADFTSSSGTVVVLGTGAAVNDEVTIRVIKVAIMATGMVNQTSTTGSAVLPSGTTAQRDASPLGGYLRWNSTLNRSEVYNDNTSAWQDVGQQSLTTEQVQDAIGPMLSGNTESGITVVYDDANNQIDFTVTSQTDENFTTADHSKLDGIETSATADQTGAEIKTLYEAETSAFTDTQFTKLGNIETAATADQTDAEIRAAVEAATDSNVFADADHTKLNAIETSATADQTGAEIKTLYEAETNAFTDAQFTKLSNIETAATTDQTALQIKTAYESNSNTNEFSDAEQTKVSNLTGTNSGDQTIVLTGNVTGSGTGSFAATIADDAVTYAKIQNVTATNLILGRDSAGAGVVEEITPTALRTMINVEDGADVTDTSNVVAALTAGTNVTISAGGTIASSYTDTTYTAGNGLVLSGTTFSAANIALTTVQTASSQSAHLALTAEEGDVVVRSDENKTYIHNSGSAGNMNDYTLLATPTDAVLSVVGLTGAVTATQIKDAVVIDEDDMASDSAVKLPSQQSVKAYVDTQILTVPDATAMAIALG